MQKAIGYIACISVMAASLYFFSGSDPSRILSAQTESAGADGYGPVARRFMNDARQHAKLGNIEHARRLAETAASLSASWQPGEQTPDQLLAELNGSSTAATDNPFNLEDDSTWPAVANAADTEEPLSPFFNEGPIRADIPEPPPLPRNASVEMINKYKAGKLMKEARAALNNGDFAMARTRAMQARALNVTWGLWDEKPEQLLAETDRLDGTSTFMADGTQPAFSEPQDASQSYQQAKALVHQARAAMAQGNMQHAMDLANKAESFNATYEMFEDSPTLVKRDITQRSQVGAAPAVAFGNSFEDSSTPKEQQAQILLGQARTALREGRVADAKSIAEQAKSLDVTYGLLQDTPEMVLAEIDRMSSGQSQQNPFAAEALTSNAQPNPFAQNAGIDMTPQSSPRSGVVALGNSVPAGRGIELTANAQEEDDDPQLPSNMDPMAEMDPLMATANELDVRFTRLRTEVLNSIFRAEKLKEKNNEEALTVLERAMESVQEADLPEESSRVLTGHLSRAQKNIQSYMDLRAPIIANEKRNQNVREAIQTQVDHQIRIEQEFADLTNQFNELMRQRRYPEAELVARKAKDLNPNLPQAVIMVEKAKLQRQVAWIEDIKEKKADNGLKALNSVDEAMAASIDDYAYPDAKSWKEMSERRSRYGGATSRTRTESEMKIESSLNEKVSLHFHSVPLTDVIRHIATTHGINIALDTRAIETEGLMADVPVSIDVDGIKLRSALNLLLQQAGGLVYDIENEVLKITNRLEQEMRYNVEVYPVADLVIPLGLDTPSKSFDTSIVNGLGINSGLYQVEDDLAVSIGGNGSTRSNNSGDGNRADFTGLVDLITTTIEPGTWDVDGGAGRLQGNENTLSLVIRQTPKVHDEIVELLGQLRKLQDLQVTVEVRFISVTDRFFERIGVDFDFNIQDTLGDPAGTPAFGSRQLTFPGGGAGAGGGAAGGQGGDLAGGGGQQQGQQGQQGQGGGLFDPINRVNSPRDDFSGQTVGLSSPDAFTEDYDIQFRQGSFELGVPDFGNFNPDAGIQVGMAILSDIEAFFFIQAAQADERSNVLFAPKVTLFNGQQATISDNTSRPFVGGLIPVVGQGAVGFQPIIQQINDGINLTVVAVISADRRYVRLSLAPTFNTLVDVFTFSFATGGAGGGAIGGQGGGGGGFGGQGGGGFGGQGGGGFGGGGFGGGGFGGFGGIGGQGGGGGGGFGGGGGGFGGGGGGQQGQAGQQGGAGGGTLTIQQPVIANISVSTTVSVPDGGTVLLGGIKRLREGRNMAGVPILNKIPYVSRLFKNSGVGRETESIMLMVTPRIIIHEEEEELILGTSGLLN